MTGDLPSASLIPCSSRGRKKGGSHMSWLGIKQVSKLVQVTWPVQQASSCPMHMTGQAAGSSLWPVSQPTFVQLSASPIVKRYSAIRRSRRDTKPVYYFSKVPTELTSTWKNFTAKNVLPSEEMVQIVKLNVYNI